MRRRAGRGLAGLALLLLDEILRGARRRAGASQRRRIGRTRRLRPACCWPLRVYDPGARRGARRGRRSRSAARRWRSPSWRRASSPGWRGSGARGAAAASATSRRARRGRRAARGPLCSPPAVGRALEPPSPARVAPHAQHPCALAGRPRLVVQGCCRSAGARWACAPPPRPCSGPAPLHEGAPAQWACSRHVHPRLPLIHLGCTCELGRSKQHGLMRTCAPGGAQTLLLTLAGVDMDCYTPSAWRAMAHEAAAYLNGSQLLQVSAVLACLPVPAAPSSRS